MYCPGCFCDTTTELRCCDGDCKAHEASNIYSLALYRKSVTTLVPSECPLLFSRKDRQLRPLPGHVLGKEKILETSLLINLNICTTICQVNNIMGTLGLLRVHGLLADWLGSERILAWPNSEMTEKPLRSQDEEGVQAL